MTATVNQITAVSSNSVAGGHESQQNTQGDQAQRQRERNPDGQIPGAKRRFHDLTPYDCGHKTSFPRGAWERVARGVPFE